MSDVEQRLRRELRAMAAVNRQLQGQLEEPGRGATARHRRAATAEAWIEALATRGKCDAHLVRGNDGAMYLIEGKVKRPIRSGILAAALAQTLGVPRDVTDDELATWDEGIPVELFEPPGGSPFMVIGGERRHARGVPLTYPVDNRQTSEIPQGADINVAAANVARYRFDEAMSGRMQVGRLGAAVRSKGVVGSAKAAAGRAKRAARKLTGST